MKIINLILNKENESNFRIKKEKKEKEDAIILSSIAYVFLFLFLFFNPGSWKPWEFSCNRLMAGPKAFEELSQEPAIR